MAASLVRGLSFLSIRSRSKASVAARATVQTSWTRTAFFRQRKGEEEAEEMALQMEGEEPIPSPLDIAKSLRKRVGVQKERAYTPPADVEERLRTISEHVFGDVADWKANRLDDNRIKYRFLTLAMTELDHFVPNSSLNDIRNAEDALAFFSASVRDTSALQDLSKLDLPPNLHIQLEPVRFNPETDTTYGGQTAFPGQPTVVASLKWQRKYGKNNA